MGTPVGIRYPDFVGDKLSSGKSGLAISKDCKYCGEVFIGWVFHKYCQRCTPKYRGWFLRKMNLRKCVECGEFLTFDENATVQHKFCKKHSHRRSRKEIARSCIRCGKEFSPVIGRGGAKLCSRKCQSIWINENDLGARHNDAELRQRILNAIKDIGIPMNTQEVLDTAGITHKTLTTRGWKMSEFYTEAGVVFPKILSSRFEARVYELLIGIFGKESTITQKTLDGLRGPKGGKLRFDFFIESHNLLVEADGSQHTGKSKFFDCPTEHDIIKNKYCLDNKIKLFRISYPRSFSKHLLKQEIITFANAHVVGDDYVKIH